MNALLSCPECGATLPAALEVCPIDGVRLVVGDALGRDRTVLRSSLGPGRDVLQARPQVTGVAPSAYASEEVEWEKSVARDVMTGRRLGDYVVKHRIGSGGMGIVYEGAQRDTGRRVAIKLLRPDFAEGGSRARDLGSEARTAAAIRHPGVIEILLFDTLPGVGQFLVMEFLDGVSLDEVIRQRAPMTELAVIDVLEPLLGALEAAHAVGVIHRDLKPDNVFVVHDARGEEIVKVLDFGLAKRGETPHGSIPQTRVSVMVGTPEYIAPEQACGQPVGPKTDLYAVGVMAFEMLTRQLPFEGESPLVVALHHVRTAPPRPSSFVHLHAAMDALVMRLLAKDPAERPESAEAVRRELGRLRKLVSQVGDSTERALPPVEAPDFGVTPVGPPDFGDTPVATAALGPVPRPRVGQGGRRFSGRRVAVADDKTPVGGASAAAMMPTRLDLPPMDHPALKVLAQTSVDQTAIPSRKGPSRKVVLGMVGTALGVALIAGAWGLHSPSGESAVVAPILDPRPGPKPDDGAGGEKTPVVETNRLVVASRKTVFKVRVDGTDYGTLQANRVLEMQLPLGEHKLEFWLTERTAQPQIGTVMVTSGAPAVFSYPRSLKPRD